MFDLELAIRLGAALGLGLLLGLERERKRDAELLFGGVRTFALIALLGALGAFMERELDQSWLILAAFVAVSALVIVSVRDDGGARRAGHHHWKSPRCSPSLSARCAAGTRSRWQASPRWFACCC